MDSKLCAGASRIQVSPKSAPVESSVGVGGPSVSCGYWEMVVGKT